MRSVICVLPLEIKTVNKHNDTNTNISIFCSFVRKFYIYDIGECALVVLTFQGLTTKTMKWQLCYLLFGEWYFIVHTLIRERGSDQTQVSWGSLSKTGSNSEQSLGSTEASTIRCRKFKFFERTKKTKFSVERSVYISARIECVQRPLIKMYMGM